MIALYVLYVVLTLIILRKIVIRLQLSKAKHPSLSGHPKMSRRVARLIPYYELREDKIFNCDGAPDDVARKRREGFYNLVAYFKQHAPQSVNLTESIEDSVSDVLFTSTYRVPFQYSQFVKSRIKLGSMLVESSGTTVKDLDGNWSYDLTGSYGVNVFGYDFYKECMEKGFEKVKDLGPVLGNYHPIVVENVNKLKKISGLDEVSFHMSGTEAVMQAVRLARYHTGKSHLVRFCGAYHGWWDGVQPGIGSHREVNDVYTLKDMDNDTMRVLRTRRDIACVLINPLQAMHLNSNAPGDSSLIASGRKANYDREKYAHWLQQLRKVCDERGIVMIMDEIFVGFRLACGGGQEYFNVKADIVTYGKTLGGGLPIGVVCGKHHLMKRFRDTRPVDICFARGTFNSHPYVLAAMNEFLHRLDTPEIRASYDGIDELWNKRVDTLNQRLEAQDLPVKIVNLTSIWTVLYTRPCRFNWMFQYYLRAQGLTISWVGSGRMIMSHNFTDEDFEQVMQRFVAAAEAMQKDSWWWTRPELSNKAIKKQIAREMLSTVFPVFAKARD